MKNKIPVTGPSITEKEIAYVTDAVKNAWYENANFYNNKFETAFATYCGSRYALALPSCTSALHLSLRVLKIGPGDEVILPDITWTATAAAITYVGATPVFADVDPHTWCLSAESFKKNITPRTKAVIPVDLYGNMPDMDALQAIAHEHHIAIIEDAAEAIGSEYKNKKAGNFGISGCFSFHGTKTLTTGEGGMLITNDEEFYKKALFLANHGRSSSATKPFWITEVGYKYKMSSMQAALGLAQLERVEELVEKKIAIFNWYKKRLANIDGITLNTTPSFIKNSYWMVTFILSPKLDITKEELMITMKEKKIDCRPFFYPLSQMPAYASYCNQAHMPKNNPISYSLSPYGINVPSGMNLTEEMVDYICDTLKEIINTKNYGLIINPCPVGNDKIATPFL